jgi:thymidylate synthase
MSSIFTIKHVVDYAHDEVMRFITENERLKARIAELEKLIPVNSNQIVHETEKDNDFDDDAMDFTFEEEESNVEEAIQQEKTEEKVVVVTTEKSRKDYQREYQKQYRQKKKQEEKK